MIDFKPIEGVPYKHDYITLVRDLHSAPDAQAFEEYRRLCREDLFFLLYFGLSNTYLNEHYKRAAWVVQRCQEIDDGPKTNTIDLWMRESFKSTFFTYGENIQDILRNPEECIAILSYNRSLAKAFLRQIKISLEGAELLKTWFPDILYDNPERESPKWSEDDGLIVKRKGNPRESTVEAWGLTDSQPTGRHFSKLVYDDVVTRDTVNTSDQLAKTLESYQLSSNLSRQGGRKRIVGTRYDYGDVYGSLLKQIANKELHMVSRIRPIRVAAAYGWEYPLFTEEESAIKEAEQGQFVFSCQMLLEPVHPDTMVFPPPPPFWTDMRQLKGVEDWPKTLLIDLAGWDESGKKTSGKDDSAFVVVAASPDDTWYIMETRVGRYDPDRIIDIIFETYQTWHWHAGYMEEEKLAKVVRFMLDKAMTAKGVQLKIKPLQHKGRSKDLRIRALQSRYENKKLVFHPDQKELLEQMRQFPRGVRRDAIDALAYGLDVISKRDPLKFWKRTPPKPTAYNRRGGW